jgi:hypothetical protein
MTKARYESRPTTPAFGALLLMALVAVICSAAIAALAPARMWSPAEEASHLVFGFQKVLAAWPDLDGDFSPIAVLRDSLKLRLSAIIASAIVGAIIGFVFVYSATPLVDRREHYDGQELLVGELATATAAKEMKNVVARGEKPIDLAEGVPFPRAWRVLNLLIIGAIGSGKTRIILWLIEQLVGRITGNGAADEALLICDTTGEIFAGLPLENREFAAMHPHRPGGYGWAMGRDLTTTEDIEEAADQGIQSTDEAMWGKGASAISAGCMLTAQAKGGSNWGMPEYYAAAMLSPQAMKSSFERCYPFAAGLIEFDAAGELSKTSVSMLLTFRASVLRTLRPLAEAWRDLAPERLISFREWVDQSNPRQPKTLVLQRSGRLPVMSALWVGMAFDLIAGHVSDDAFPVSQTRTRSLVLDELPTLGNLKKLPQLLDTGRNKGVCAIAAVQDLNQLQVYGKSEKSVKGRFRLKLFGAQTPGPELKEIAEKEIGMRRVVDRTFLKTVTRGAQGRSEQVAENERIDDVPIVSEHYFAHRLGVYGKRVRAVLVGLEEFVQLEWPMRVWPRQR